jgi:acyl dehydratase
MPPLHLVERRFCVDRAAIRRYADVSRDYNPIHLDPEFAAKTPMGGVIAHGMLSLSLVWHSLAATFGWERLAGAAVEIRFVRPVRENDWVVSGGTLVDDDGVYDVWVRRETDTGAETVISGTARLAALPGETTAGDAEAPPDRD